MGLKEEFYSKYCDRETYERYRKEKHKKDKDHKKDKEHKKDRDNKKKKDYKKDKHELKKDKEKKDKKSKKQRDLCNIEPKEIKEAMSRGARTRQDLVKMLGICNECDNCRDKVDAILMMACKCKNVSMQQVILAIRNGADTVEKIEKETGAGLKCGKCKKLLQNMIELGY